jgi:hypothetical protein
MARTISAGGPVPAWQINQHTYELGYAALTAVDDVANALQQSWGRGRLRLLAPDDLRVKFDRQRSLLNNAEWHGGIDDLKLQCQRSINAWRALEKNALGMGLQPDPLGEVWHVYMPNGNLLVLVPESEATHAYVKKHASEQVWSLEELAHLVAAQDDVVKAIKDQFAGAVVTRVEKMPPVGSLSDEDIPF